MFRRDHQAGNVAQRVDRLMEAVFVADRDARTTRLAADLAPDFVYVGPDGVYDGADGLSDAFAGYRHEEWRHAALRRTSPVELHHGYFRFTWARLERGATVMEGWGFGSLDETGLVRRVVVFEGLEPSRFAGGA
jgi:hypothetical protein